MVTLDPRASRAFMDGTVLRDIPLEVYLDARHILEVRQHLRRRLAQELPVAAAAPETELLSDAATRVAGGEDVFGVLADLSDLQTANGYPEVLMLKRDSRRFCNSQELAESFYEFLADLGRMWLPELVR